MSEAQLGRRMLDVSRLPTIAFGHRDPLWWAVWLLISIESTMFAMLATSYFYLRGNFSEWPPAGSANAPLPVSLTTIALLVISGVPAYFAFRAALDGTLRVVQLGMSGATIVSALAAVARWFELEGINYKWNTHAYGSIVWAIYFMHSFHLLSGVIENAVMTVLLYKGPVEKKHILDVSLGTIYWWFVIVAWIPFWLLITLDEVVLR
ncbi:MAG: cytochrome c oxidase subunit 3 [Thermoanaerobaculia bacterium]